MLKPAAAALLAFSTASAGAQTRASAVASQDLEAYARVVAMADARAFRRPAVDAGLRSSWAPLRQATSRALGQIGAPHADSSRALLHMLLSDRDPVVAANAAFGLGLLRDSLSVSRLAAALLASPGVAREAAWSLGEIGSPARTAITSALSRPSTDVALQLQLLLAAAKLRPVPVEEIRPYLRLRNGSVTPVVWAASYAIARPRASSGVRDLVGLYSALPSSEAPVSDGAFAGRSRIPIAPTADAYASAHQAALQRTRAEIARALWKPAAGDSLGDAALSVLLKLVTDVHPHVRVNALRSLGSYDARARNAIVAATRDRNSNVRIAAAQSLGTVLDRQISGWAAVWAADTSFMFRSSVLASAARAGVPLPGFRVWSTHGDWRYRAALLTALAEWPASDGEAARLARQLVSDRDSRVRAAAFALLAGPDSIRPQGEVKSALTRGLRDEDPIVRATVLGALSRNASAKEVPVILDAFERSRSDRLSDARVAAMRYLRAAWVADSAGFGPDLRRRLTAMRPPGDRLVRAPVEAVTPLRSWTTVADAERPHGWYVQVVREYVVPALQGRAFRTTISTVRGPIELDLFAADAPLTVKNFMDLARAGFYRGTRFHRVVPNFVAQDGDPRGDGNGGPDYAIRDELNRHRYERGILGMALAGPDTGGSQYFITHSPQPHLDGHYTIFGRVRTGFAALDALVQGDAIISVRVP